MNRILYTLVVAMLFATSALATIIRVPADQPTIQAGINAAVSGDTVLVADGTYYENIDFKGKAITVASRFILDGKKTHIARSIINGSRPSHPDSGSVVYFINGEDITSMLCGFTITGGSGTKFEPETDARVGGGICAINSCAHIKNNHIVKNRVHYDFDTFGGGIYFWGSTIATALLKTMLSKRMGLFLIRRFCFLWEEAFIQMV